jgi:NADPH-dependent 7-cyano-7-deazaguanine reductase QueF
MGDTFTPPNVGRRDHLEVFAVPYDTMEVEIIHPVTAQCPVTGHEQYYTVRLRFCPQGRCVTAISCRLYFERLSSLPVFSEQLAGKIREDFSRVLNVPVFVELTHKFPEYPGGIYRVALS